MSRGPGILQRRICGVLQDAGDGGLPLRELRRRVGDPDRSNLRRVVRGFLEHGMVEESFRHGERRVALTDRGHTAAAAVARAGRRAGDKPRVYRGSRSGASTGSATSSATSALPPGSGPRAGRSGRFSRHSATAPPPG